MKKKYIILGDNNFWYATTDLITQDELLEEVEAVKESIRKGEYVEQQGKELESTLYIVEVNAMINTDLIHHSIFYGYKQF